MEAIETVVAEEKETLTEAEQRLEEAAIAKNALDVDKTDKVESTKDADIEIDGLEKTEDGYEYTLGNSVYRGATLKDVFASARKGIEDKDKASKELDTALRELKAKRVIREPEETEKEDELHPPSERDILKSVFDGTDLQPRMLNWDENQWLDWGEKQGLRDLQIQGRMERVEKLRQEAQKLLNAETTLWLNRSALRERLTPAVQRMVAKSGLDAEEHKLGDFYYQLLKDPKYKGKDGLFNGEDIVEAVYDEILKYVKPAKESAVSKAAEVEKQKLAQKKRELGSGVQTAVKTKINEKSPPNIEEASKRALSLLK